MKPRPMAKDQELFPTALRARTPLRATPSEPPRKRFNLVQFGREVRAEARKTTWTSWKETWITSVMVGIMVVTAALFFFGVDALFGFGMNLILKVVNAG
ncbi:MAG: preprotein translocase subunit SecE [Caulobacterales bacterium]